jgi:hypothetical protein
MLFTAAPLLGATVVGFPEYREGGPDAHLVVPVSIAPADGVLAVNLAFTYDPAIVEWVGVHKTALTRDATLNYVAGPSGLVNISLSQTKPLSGSGPLLQTVFRSLGSPGSGTTLSWTELSLNEGRIASVSLDGYLQVQGGSSIISMPDDAVAPPGSQVTIPIIASPADGALAFDLTVEFNSLVIQPLSVAKTPITQGFTLTANTGIPGTVLISMFDDQVASGTGPIAEITFQVLGAAGEATPLDLTRGLINEGLISATLDDGLFTVCSDSDGDGDGVSQCAGDCDDGNNMRFPGNTEECNGIDNDCNGVPDDGIAPAPSNCGVGQCAGNTGEIVCVDGSELDNCDPFLGATAEQCDGLDNDCNGTADNGFLDTDLDGLADCVDPDDDEDGVADADDCAPLDASVSAPPDEVVALTVAGLSPTTVSWSALGPGEAYDVSGGLVAELAVAGGVADATCLQDDTASPAYDDPRPEPDPGMAYYYVVRGTNVCDNGSYGFGTSGERLPALACP